ncbi:hypothetical protein GCM10027047_39480 [Rhodococcus aerolatus]
MSASFDVDGPTPGSAVLTDDGTAYEVVEDTTPDGDVGYRYPTLPEFVSGFVATTWIREVGGVHWCASWWRHREAQVRLEALWRTYEAVRGAQDPSTMSGFLRTELDYHLGVLTSEEGPFWGCDYRRNLHRPQEPWPTEAPPEGLFLPDVPPPA